MRKTETNHGWPCICGYSCLELLDTQGGTTDGSSTVEARMLELCLENQSGATEEGWRRHPDSFQVLGILYQMISQFHPLLSISTAAPLGQHHHFFSEIIQPPPNYFQLCAYNLFSMQPPECSALEVHQTMSPARKSPPMASYHTVDSQTRPMAYKA